MTRDRVDLAFVVLGCRGAEGGVRYALQLNRHLNGYNFFGGHVDEQESPDQAALRELREEVGAREMKERWGLNLDADPPEQEWAALATDLKEIDGGFLHPFFSLRAHREGKAEERVARLHAYRTVITPERHPNISKRLDTLTETSVASPWDGKERPLCRLFSPEELMDDAWQSPYNPFPRFFIKRGAIDEFDASATALPFVLDVPRFEAWVEDRLNLLFKHALRLEAGEEIAVTVMPPGEEDVDLALASNYTLQARLEVRWTGSMEVYRARFPYPYHGVFLLRSDNQPKSGRWIWHPRLKCLPGVWRVRKFTSDGVKNLLRLALDGRRGPWSIDTEGTTKARENSAEQVLKTWKRRTATLLPDLFLDTPAPGSLWPRDGDQEFSLFLYGAKERNAFLKTTTKVGEETSDEPLDEQDLSYQRLVTYSAWLGEQILERIVEQALRGAGKRAGHLAQQLRGRGDVDAKDAEAVWNTMCQRQRNAGPIVDVQMLRRQGWLHAFDPLNAIQAVSELTSFQRYDYRSKTLEDLPASWRQNHPSFDGIVCPVESPENPKVGIALHLARGVFTDVVGRIHQPLEDGHDGLGYAASLVPFFEYNDAPRSMMGAKNLKQALQVSGAEPPLVRTGTEVVIGADVEPLERLMPGITSTDSCEPGANMLVAYLPWYGWNFEDAIVANQRLAEEGVLDWFRDESFEVYIHPGYEPCPPEGESGSALRQALLESLFLGNGRADERSFRKPGLIIPGDPVAFFRDTASGQVVSIAHRGEGPGELVEVTYSAPESELFGGRLAWRVRYRVSLTHGDKLMGRHGNKGLIGKMFPAGELPRMPDDPRLPEDLRGRAVDLILNPHGVISRMNIGQLIETQVGLVRVIRPDAIPEMVGQAFTGVNVAGALREAYTEINGQDGAPVIDQFGRMYLTLPGGGTTAAPVTVGLQYILRLKHIPRYKAQARRGDESDALYQTVTGQPAGGRRYRGGQRVGEMEIWALAAHRAEENLREILGPKSDPSSNLGLQTLQAIKDHLYALGIELSGDRADVHVKFSETENSGNAIVEGAFPWRFGIRGEFRCPKPGCEHRFPRRDILSQSETGRDVRFLSLGDVLRHESYRLKSDELEGTLVSSAGETEEEKKLRFSLRDLATGEDRKDMVVKIMRRVKDLGGTVTIDKLKVQVYRQVHQDKELHLKELESLAIACPTHKSSRLACAQPRLVLMPRPGGFADPELSGTADVTNPDTRWAYIDLPFEVTPSVFEKKESGLAPIRRLPVLPLKYRYRPLRVLGGIPVSGYERLPRLYEDLTKAIDGYRKAKKDFQYLYTQQIEDLVNEIFRFIWERLAGKKGLMRRQGLGRRVNRSGRLVIVPDPELAWNECGVPVEVLAHLLADRIADWRGLPDAVDDHLLFNYLKAWESDRNWEAALATGLREEISSPEFWRSFDWLKRGSHQKFMTGVKSVLEAYLLEHHDIRVLLNRAPSLHKYNFLACRPVPLGPDEGLVLRINPLVCKGLAADFDGDEISIHIPDSDAAHLEASRLEPTHPQNLMSVANGHSLAHYDQDFVLGHYLLLQDTKGRKKLNDLFGNCGVCHAHLADPASAQQLLDHLCEHHLNVVEELVPDWMRLAFEAVTEAAISFGFLELDEIRPDYAAVLNAAAISGSLDKEMGEHMEDLNEKLGEVTLNRLKEVVSSGDLSAPGYGFAAMAVSGARGKKQTRQLITARGFLDPGEIAFQGQAADFFIPKALVDGMSRSEAFWGAMNGRSSMIDKKLGTPCAGGLTRALVLACWPWYIAEEDCGAVATAGEPRSIGACNRVRKGNGICAACYGPVPGYGDSVPVGYPAGLIAAQSTGERGTQLSMQSFHTGTKALSISDVVALFQGKDPDPETEDGTNWFVREGQAKPFVDRLRQVNAYSGIDERHLVVIWHAIHASGARSLRDVPRQRRDVFSAVAAGNQWEALQALIAAQAEASTDQPSPFGQVLLSQPPVLKGAPV